MFEAAPITEATNSAAIALDAQLQTYLFAYLGRSQNNAEGSGSGEDKKPAKATVAQTEEIYRETSTTRVEESNDDSDLPF